MNTGYPTLNFGLGEEMDMLRDAVYQMCQKEIAPRAAQIDRDNQFPADLWRKFGDMGLLGITVAEEYGGASMGYLAHSIVMEEISRASASVGLSYGGAEILFQCTDEAGHPIESVEVNMRRSPRKSRSILERRGSSPSR